MKKLIMKLLGLESLVTTVLTLRKENEELKKSLAELTEKVDEIETPDMDNYVSEDDINDRIESYLNDNDYATRDWVTDEINDQIDTDRIVEECVEKLEDDIEEKVRDLFNDASPSPMSEEDIKKEVAEAVKKMDKASFGDTEELRSIVRSVLRDGRIKFE